MKPWYRSRTIWANAAVAALIALEAKFSMLAPVLPVNVYAVIAVALPVLNTVLRVVTTQGVALRRAHDD